jgi:hypothetical protein
MSVAKVSSLAFAAWMISAGAFAADGEWTVRKSSGEVWTGAAGLQLVSLGQSQAQETVLKPGDTITTGRNGRVLLVRGQETILIAPNSIVGVPVEKKDGLATTITQQAGSILLEVEKRNVPHFEVETPYLAAVVKGTQFRVSVTATGTRVDVQRGKVEVVDFKSGQIAQVLPGQAAQSFAHGAQGLALTGTGALEPIVHGAPRAPTLEQIKVPKSGIRMPPTLERGKDTRSARGTHQDARTASGTHHGAVRISAPLGEMRLNVQKVTHGLARSAGAANDAGRRAAAKETTIWNASDSKSATGAATIAGTDSSNSGNSASASGASASSTGASTAASVSGVSAATAAVAAGSSANGNGNGNGNGNSGGNGNGNGKGNNGNGNGNGKGNNGNGNGNGKGGNGNGNGNGGNGNGNGNGHGKGKS